MKLTLFILLFAFQCNAVELLVKARSVAHSDPVEDRVGRTKVGMVVDVRPDGFKWGSKEGFPDFYIIKLPGVKPDEPEIKKWREVEMDATGTNVYRARKYIVALTNLSSTVQSKLTTDGTLDTSKDGVSWVTLKTNIVSVTANKFEPVKATEEKP